MILFIAIGVALALSATVFILVHYFEMPFKISFIPWLVISLVTTVLIAPGAVALGGAVAKSNALTFNEYWNGYETAALVTVTNCERDGSCRHEYRCDPYQVVKTRTVSDGNGKTRTETYVETEWHQCPYVTKEYTYKVETTLEDYNVASHVFAADPEPWRWGEHIPGNVSRGEPAAWVAVRDRLAAKDPGPVTAVRNYDNFILASQSSILKRYSAEIEAFEAKGWLPLPASGAEGLYANKAYPVNTTLTPEWSNSVMRFNAAFGVDLQGDLHLVVAKGVSDPDAYTGALQAYWQSPELGRDALSKNTLVVVLGTDDSKTVSWARVFTGMPTGNEKLMVDIESQLKGAALTPATILGAPRGVIKGDEVSVSHTDGLLEKAVWGTNQFERACMVCDDAEDSGLGFSYLSGEIQPSGAAKTGIVFFSIFTLVASWVIAIAITSNR